MSIVTVLASPTARRALGYGVLAVALVGAGAGLVWWGLGPRIDLAEQSAARSAQDLASAKATIEDKNAQLLANQVQADRLNQVELAVSQLSVDIRKYNSDQARAFEDLKRNDQETMQYLAGAVPERLGRLYERPETTDPRAYGSPAIVQPGAVPSAGTAGARAE
ncbi:MULTISPECIES: hypothetical protein [Pseudomonas]|uniref:hypothetical protein n=1 Tax=Pseudomonas TaxID=286 RepID=UPI003A88ED7C